MTFFPGGKKFAKILRASGLYHCPGDSKKEGKEIHPDRSKLLMSHILDNPGKSKKKGNPPRNLPLQSHILGKPGKSEKRKENPARSQAPPSRTSVTSELKSAEGDNAHRSSGMPALRGSLRDDI